MTVGYAVLRQADGANALGKGRDVRQVRQGYQNSLLFILLEMDAGFELCGRTALSWL